MSIFSRIFGGDGGDSIDAAERILERAAPGSEITAKAAPNAGSISLLSHPFLRGAEGDGGSGRSVSRPYEQSPWVQRAIRHVAEPIMATPLRFAMMTPDGSRAYVDPRLTSFWAWPAVSPTGKISLAGLVDATVAWLLLAGEAFWVLDESWLIPGAPRKPFFVARPDSMRPILAEDGATLRGWKLRDARGRDWYLLPEQVVQPKIFSPYDPVRGCAPWASARVAAETDIYASEFARSLMKNNGDRGPIISTKGSLSNAQMTQIEAGLRAKRAAAANGQTRTTFLPADVEIHDPQVTSADADFVASRIDNRKEVYMAFGVPSSFAEQKARATTAHESDRYILIEDTCVPMAARIAPHVAALSARLLALGDDEHLSAYFDFDGHSAMVAARAELVDVAAKLCALGMPFRDANTFLFLRAPSFPGDGVGHLPLAVQTITEANTAHVPPTGPAAKSLPPTLAPQEDATAIMLRALSAPIPTDLERALAATVEPPVPLDVPAVPPVVRTTPGDDADAEQGRTWERLMRQRRPQERLMQKSVTRVIFAARSEVLRKIESTARKAGAVPVTKDDDDKKDQDGQPHPGKVADLLPDQTQFRADLIAAVEKIARHSIQVAGDDLRDELGITDPWVVAPSELINALRVREPLISGAADEIFETIKSELEEGFQAGDTTQELADRVRSVFNSISQDRAENIAVTETGAAYSTGRDASAQAAGCKIKTWLNARDKRVRPDHVQAVGQTVKAGDLFTVGGESTPYPCGPGLSAAQACRCQCVATYQAAAVT